MTKIVCLLGALFAFGSLSLYIVLAFFNPYAPGHITVPMVAMIFLAIWGIIASLTEKPYLMLTVSLVSFVPIGLYLLGTPGIFRWIGACNLLLLLASLLLLYKKLLRTT
jgi:hypothetical protein